MCGILGIFGKQLRAPLKRIQHRGKDASSQCSVADGTFYHCLHAVVGHVTQPLENNNHVFMSNCEIYNWKELKQTHNLKGNNDAEILFALLQKKGIAALKEVDGVYAFAWSNGKTITLARDILGVKPLCYIENKNESLFAFASEAKALRDLGTPKELEPTQILEFNLETQDIKINKRKFFTLPKQTTHSKEKIMQEIEKRFSAAIRKRIAGTEHVGILFSGGIDSTLVALVCQKLKIPFTCYTAAFQDGNTRESPDLLQAQKVAQALNFPLKHVTLNLKQTQKLIKEVIPIIETTNVVKVGVALPFYAAAKMAHKDGHKVLLSGLGSEELFAGYKRHKDALNINEECLAGLAKMWQRDLYRDDLLTMAFPIELRLPFLDHNLTKYALGIPPKHKINNSRTKVILRETAKEMGLQEEFAFEKKRAAQYGSNFDKAIEKLAKKAGQTKKEYLDSF